MNKTTVVFLIRHGEIANPKKIYYGSNIDLELSDLGRNHIKHIAVKLKKRGEIPQAIYTSPLKRAYETAHIIAKELGIKKLIVEKNLKDVDIPALAGEKLSLRKILHSQGLDEYSEKFVAMGNESKRHLVTRIRNAFFKIIRKNSGDIIAIVSHGDPIAFLLYTLMRPNGTMPQAWELEGKSYPKKGSVVRLLLSSDGNLLKKDVL